MKKERKPIYHLIIEIICAFGLIPFYTLPFWAWWFDDLNRYLCMALLFGFTFASVLVDGVHNAFETYRSSKLKGVSDETITS